LIAICSALTFAFAGAILACAIGKARDELSSYFADKGWKATVVSRQP
jgi:hypothetical protein